MHNAVSSQLDISRQRNTFDELQSNNMVFYPENAANISTESACLVKETSFMSMVPSVLDNSALNLSKYNKLNISGNSVNNIE